MPDLNIEGIHKFWHEYHDPLAYKAICFMENVEAWTFDGNPELEQAVTKFATALDDIGYIDLQEEDKIIQIATSIKMGRMLRLLQYLDIAHPGAASKLLMFAKENSDSPDDEPGVFLRRNMVFERLRILGRVFAEDRLNTVLKILGDKGNA
ncbi:MAG: IcmW [uncultured bacterium]|nr:MAG: IcmW [uncultured bacterium]